ncbi:MAG: right-handed parallel beta-helix repeat-containing protein [Phycisphaerae bacterium]|nr:right-handed parallel beta-helix repeat-containing protein [Phycisphaerae bacterium]
MTVTRDVRTPVCLLIVAAAAVGVWSRSAYALTLYVAAGGNDAWSGRAAQPNVAGDDGPLASLERARDEIRKLRKAGKLPAGEVVVEVGGGVYELSRTFELTAEDSGTKGAPITYRAKRGAEVRLVGGKVVTGFKPVTDPAILKRLDEPARGKVLQVDLKAMGIQEFGSPEGGGIELFFKDRPMTVARWPNEGFVRIADIVVKDGHKIHGRAGSKVGQFVYEGDRPKRWRDEKDPWLHGYWFWDWSEQRQRLELIDVEKRILTLAKPYHGYGYAKGQWYYGFNMLCEIDSPGEWTVDRQTGVLYFWPPEPIESGKTIVSVLPTLVNTKDASYVTLRGFVLEAARGRAVTIAGGAGMQVVGCTIRNVGGWAVAITGGAESGVVGCDIYQTGAGGVSVTGGDRKTLTPGRHFVENNHIHHYSRWRRVYQPGIHLHGVGNRAAHNLIHNAPHMGMGFSGNDHVIELNEIHSVCYESNDAGAIYTGRDWTMRGTVIRHNYMHHVSGFEGKGCVGVYLDDMFCGTTIRGNVFHKVTAAAFIGGGRDCTIENNVFVDCNPAVHVDARALGWAHGCSDAWIKEGKEKGTISGIAYNKPPYSERYPRLVNILKDDPAAPRGNVVARNICVGGKWDRIEAKARPLVTLKDNLVDVDPHFVDAAKQDYRLREDSPAFALGFKRIPVEKIGLYEDDRRASWPVAHEVRK